MAHILATRTMSMATQATRTMAYSRKHSKILQRPRRASTTTVTMIKSCWMMVECDWRAAFWMSCRSTNAYTKPSRISTSQISKTSKYQLTICSQRRPMTIPMFARSWGLKERGEIQGS